MKRENLEPIVIFTCPKCGRRVEIRETEDNNLTCISDEHRPNFENKNYCMHFNKCDYYIYGAGKGLIRHELPLIFSSLNRIFDDKITLNAALKALHEGKLGISITVPKGFVYVWKRRDRYYGIIREGVLTPENFVATKDFEEIKEFVEKWYNWGK